MNKNFNTRIFFVLFFGLCITAFIGTINVETYRKKDIDKLSIPIKAYIEEDIYANPNSEFFQHKNNNNDSISIPNTHLISSFSGTYSSSYETKKWHTVYRTYTNRYYNIFEHKWESYTRKEPYTYSETIYNDYKYSFSMFILKYHDKYGLLDSDELKSRYFTSDYEQKISDFDYWIFEPYFYWKHPNKNIQAISYRVNSNNKIDTIRTIFYANEKIYLLETRSEYDATKDANEILKNFAIYNPLKYKMTIEAKVSLPYLLLILFALIIILLTNIIPKSQIKNKYALTMLRILSAIMMTSTILVTIQWHLLYTGSYANVTETYIVFYIMSIIISYSLMLYMRSKCKQDFSFDYIIPHWIKLYMDNRKITNSEKLLFVIFIGYPFYLTSLPWGTFVFIYIIPVFLIFILTCEFRILYIWVNNKNKSNNKTRFKDYYLILDANQDASTNDIEMAFYKALSKTNSTKAKINIREAYMVLSSNILRPLYDNEYILYMQSTNFDEYKFSNKKLEHDISLITNGVNKWQKNIVKLENVNVVILALLIYFILFLIII